MKTIVKEKVINRSMNYLYNKWTTKEGLNSFFSVDNNIEMKLYGKYEIYFSLDEKNEERGSEDCVVLSFIPNRLLSFTWNVPPQFKELRASKKFTWVVVEFQKADNNTLVRLTNTGYLDDEDWNPVFKYFDRAWDIVMDNLEKSCR